MKWLSETFQDNENFFEMIRKKTVKGSWTCHEKTYVGQHSNGWKIQGKRNRERAREISECRGNKASDLIGNTRDHI